MASSADDGRDLARAVLDAEREIDAEGERLVYLSVPPGAMQDMVGMLGETGIADHCSLVVEKPFGHDLASARELNAALHEVLDEESIYRIDHFLGKEAAQNILALRFANGILEPVWNRDHISYVQIDVPEELDIQGRAAFYEETGAFRDMVVTHLMQILGIVALEPPSRIDAESVHLERTKVFDAIRPLDPERVVFGQYDGLPRRARRRRRLREGDVRRARGVGRHLALERRAVLPAHRQVDGRGTPDGDDRLHRGSAADLPRTTIPTRRVRPSELVFELSDDPQVRIEVQAKVPGPEIDLGRAALTLDVDEAFEGADGLEAYERLLHDVMLRDHLLFTRAEQIERLWEVCAPVIDIPAEPEPYAEGSWGPEAALALPAAPGWRLPDGGSG